MKTYSLSEVADMAGVSLRTVEAWVSSGELIASNVSQNRASKKKRLRVIEHHFEEFMKNRQVIPEVKVLRKPRFNRNEIVRIV